jgi:hypothetical protein
MERADGGIPPPCRHAEAGEKCGLTPFQIYPEWDGFCAPLASGRFGYFGHIKRESRNLQIHQQKQYLKGCPDNIP